MGFFLHHDIMALEVNGMDDFRFDVRCETMIKRQLKARGITDTRVLKAMRNIPREHFIDDALKQYAYEDTPLTIGEGQTISQPYIVALMSEALALKSSDIVYEIGTGSGYQTAILAEIVDHVHTIERLESLSLNAQKTLHQLGYKNITFHVHQGSLDINKQFDKIIVTAAARKLPESLQAQLKEGGIIVIPIGGWFQTLYRIKKQGNKLTKEALCDVRFVPLIET